MSQELLLAGFALSGKTVLNKGNAMLAHPEKNCLFVSQNVEITSQPVKAAGNLLICEQAVRPISITSSEKANQPSQSVTAIVISPDIPAGPAPEQSLWGGKFKRTTPHAKGRDAVEIRLPHQLANCSGSFILVGKVSVDSMSLMNRWTITKSIPPEGWQGISLSGNLQEQIFPDRAIDSLAEIYCLRELMERYISASS